MTETMTNDLSAGGPILSASRRDDVECSWCGAENHSLDECPRHAEVSATTSRFTAEAARRESALAWLETI